MSSKNALNNEDLLIVPTNKSSVRKGRLRKMTSADVVSSMALHPDEKLPLWVLLVPLLSGRILLPCRH